MLTKNSVTTSKLKRRVQASNRTREQPSEDEERNQIRNGWRKKAKWKNAHN